MLKSEVLKPIEKTQMTPNEKQRLVDFFSLLIEIDQKNKRKAAANGNK